MVTVRVRVRVRVSGDLELTMIDPQLTMVRVMVRLF